MQFLNNREILPVFYSDFPVYIIPDYSFTANAMAIRLHWHERFELLLIKSGSLELYCANEHMTLETGDVAIISPKLLHSGFSGKNGVIYDVLAFDADHFLNNTSASDVFIKPICNNSCIFEHKTSNSEIAAQIEALVKAYKNREKYNPLIILGYIYNLIGLLYTHCQIIQNPSTLVEKKFDKIVNYVNENFADDISSSSLSEKFGYDEAYFCRKFKNKTGLTVMKYIQVLRLEKANTLLSKSALSIRDISIACGFSDMAYFANCYKKFYNIPPSKMREIQKKSSPKSV